MTGKSLLDTDFLESDDDVSGQDDQSQDDVIKNPPEKEDDDFDFEMQEVQKPQKKQEKEKDPVDIEVVDDTPDKDKGKWIADDERDGPPDLPDEEEIKQYSKKVKARINEMTARMHAERRAREEREREMQEAMTIAKRLLHENNSLKSVIEQGEKVLLGEHKGRLEGELAKARSAFRVASEAGDTDGMLTAQEQIAKVIAQMEQVARQRPQALPRQEEQEVFRPVQPPQPQVDPKAVKWRDENRWFGRDEAMTAYVMGLHTQLVNREGVDPASDDYYKRINSEMRKRFPERFETEQRRQQPPQRSGTIVAAPSRSNRANVAPKKVTLTESQARLARRLGLTLEQYAEQLIAEEKSNGKDFTHFS